MQEATPRTGPAALDGTGWDLSTGIAKTMICKCICKCQNQAGGQTGAPDLCIECALMDSLGDSEEHHLPYPPEDMTPLPALEPITDAQKDKAIETAMEGLI